jgi:septal ring factor EnvC (AmiA/AmiB activator)
MPSDEKSAAAKPANKAARAASKRTVRLEAAAPAAAAPPAGPDLSPIIKKAVADIEALETRLAKLEVASLEDRVASLEKMSVSMTALQQRSSDELKELSERIAELRRTVSGIDNRVACMLKASLEHSMGLTASLENI